MIGSRIGHFRVIDRIGAGGMGEVYLARDEHLDRDVALKVLPAGLLADERARRHFRREALALSRLNHPNIATVHDFATFDGTDVLVMEYVAGQTMSDRLSAGALREADAVRLAAQMAEGLAAAHAAGVVHRDLKPGNLRILPDGRLKILDFGLATLRQPVGEEEETRTRTAGLAVAGTLPYMAPEQVRGEPADARTDLYAFGVTLFEMVTGERPFRDTNTLRLAEAVLHEACPLPGRLAPALSLALEQAILKCTEKDPDLRYQSATDLLVDLRRASASRTASLTGTPEHPVPQGRRPRRWAMAAGVGIIAVALALAAVAWRAGYLGRPGTASSGAAPRVRSIAVLPLANLSGDPQQEYFADGMTEALTTDLARIGALKVISRTSAMQYKGTKKALPQIARELGVDAVVEGSVLQAGGRVRITGQLILAATDEHLWARSYDRDVRDVLALHGEVAQAIAREIQVALTPDERQRLQRRRRVDPAAQEAYLRGLFAASRFTPVDMERAIGFYQQAVAEDPTCAEAHAMMGHAYLMRALPLGGNLTAAKRQDLLIRARAAAGLAIQTDETVSSAHVTLGAIALMLDRDWTGAARELRRSLDLDANNALAHMYLALLSIVLDRRDDARRELERAAELNPMAAVLRAEAGEFSLWLRDYHRAVAFATQALELAPAYPRAHFVLARVYETQGRIADAISEYEKAGWSAERVEAAREALKRGGRTGFYRWCLSVMPSPGGRADALYLAYVQVALGLMDEAIATLERAYGDGEPLLFLVASIEWFEPLHGDSRFQALERRLGLPH
jgi:TolB-like protein